MEKCLQSEQGSYEVAKRVWADLPVAMQAHCVDVATSTTGGSYMILEGCLKQEMDSKRDNAKFQFKY
ncbi:hypothetical protein D3C77_670580 [compost metagenome]